MPDSANDSGRVVESAEEVLSAMRLWDVPLSPENYHVWFEYVTGNDDALREAIDAIKESKRPFTLDVCERLYEKYVFEQGDFADARRAQKSTYAILRRALDGILSTSNVASSFRGYLSSYVGSLGEATQLNGVERMVQDMIREAERMAQSTLRFEGELKEVASDAEELKKELEVAREKASTDPLTGLHNRAALNEHLEALSEVFRKNREPFSVIMLDIDRFRSFNTKYGHQVGDAVLRVVSATLRDCLKGKDFVARYGGEEFIVLLPATVLGNACTVAEQIRQAVSSKRHQLAATGEMLVTVTVSLGVAEVNAKDTGTSVVDRADKALYRAKDSGRDQYKSERDLESEEGDAPSSSN